MTNDEYLVKQSQSYPNPVPLDNFNIPRQDSNIFKEDMKILLEKPGTDLANPTQLSTQDRMMSLKPASPMGTFQKDAQHGETFFNYSPEDRPDKISFPEITPKPQAMPQNNAPTNDDEIEKLLQRLKTRSEISDQLRGGPLRLEEKKGGELSDSEYSIFQELFGTRDTFANSNSFKTNLKDDITPIQRFDTPFKPEGLEPSMRFSNLGLEANSAQLMPPN
jgi:hypothetical protein